MSTPELTRDSLQEAGQRLRDAGPVHMLNLLRFRARADYTGWPGQEACSGQEAYIQRYAPAFARVAAEVAPGESFQVSFLGAGQGLLVGRPDQRWDMVALIAYPSFETMRKVVESPLYGADAEPHRKAALEDWLFLATTRVELPS